MAHTGASCATVYDPSQPARTPGAKGTGETAQMAAFLKGKQDFRTASSRKGVGSGLLAAWPSACTAARELVALGSMTIAHQSVASSRAGSQR